MIIISCTDIHNFLLLLVWLIHQITNDGTARDNFDHQDIAPLVKLDEKKYILELWHGPTAAFKEVCGKSLPQLMELAEEKLIPADCMAAIVAF